MWKLNARLGSRISLDIDQKVVAVIPTYNVKRFPNIEWQARSLLKCSFIKKVIITNNNPEIKIEEKLTINDQRLLVINQPVRRGAGSAWYVASQEDFPLILVLDDDLLLFPHQIAVLINKLANNPEIPHGLIGQCGSTYCLNQDIEVDNQYEVYAATKIHALRFVKIVDLLSNSGYVSHRTIEVWGDDIILSHVGVGKHRIHDAGYLLCCPTSTEKGVATYKEPLFQEKRIEVRKALGKMKLKVDSICSNDKLLSIIVR